jgi:type II secretory pathway pseudopilin PulG
MPPRAHSLVETLTVVVLLSLAVALLTPLVGSATENAVLDGAVRGLLDLDARARLRAQGGNGARIARGDGEGWFILCGDCATDERWGHWLPSGTTLIELRNTEGAELGEIEYDASGRSPDYVAIVRLDDVSRTVRVAGLTGWSEAGQ